MLRPFFPELVMSTDLSSLEHPSVLLFCLQDRKKEAGGVWEKCWSDSTLFAIHVLLDNSSVLCNKLFWGNPFMQQTLLGKSIYIYNKYRKFTHHFVLLRLFLHTPRATQSRHPTCVVIHCENILQESEQVNYDSILNSFWGSVACRFVKSETLKQTKAG